MSGPYIASDGSVWHGEADPDGWYRLCRYGLEDRAQIAYDWTREEAAERVEYFIRHFGPSAQSGRVDA